MFVIAVSVLSSACGDDAVDFDFDYREVSNLTSCSVSVQGYYYLGGIFSYDGANPVGPQREQAVKQAILDINANQVGIHGKKLGLVSCNTTNSAIAAQRMTELVGVSPGLSGVIGGSGSADVLAEAAIAIANGVPLMAGSATSPAITALADDGWVARTAPSDALQGVINARLAFDAGFRRVFVMHVNDAYGNGFHNAFRAAFLGFDPGNETQARAYASNFGSAPTPGEVVEEARSFVAASATQTAVLIIGFTAEGRDIINYANANGFRPARYFFGDALRQQPFIDAVTDKTAIQGSLGTVPSAPTGQTFDAFSARYQGSWGRVPVTFGANFYDVAMLLGLAMQLSDDPENREQVRQNLLNNTKSGTQFAGAAWAVTDGARAPATFDYLGASGNVDLDASGDVVGNIDTWQINPTNTIEKTGCKKPDLSDC